MLKQTESNNATQLKNYKMSLVTYKKDRSLWEKMKKLQIRELQFARNLLLEKTQKIYSLTESNKSELAEKDQTINYLLGTITTLETKLMYQEEKHPESVKQSGSELDADQQFLRQKLQYHHMMSGSERESTHQEARRSERLPSFNKFVSITEEPMRFERTPAKPVAPLAPTDESPELIIKEFMDMPKITFFKPDKEVLQSQTHNNSNLLGGSNHMFGGVAAKPVVSHQGTIRGTFKKSRFFQDGNNVMVDDLMKELKVLKKENESLKIFKLKIESKRGSSAKKSTLINKSAFLASKQKESSQVNRNLGFEARRTTEFTIEEDKENDFNPYLPAKVGNSNNNLCVGVDLARLGDIVGLGESLASNRQDSSFVSVLFNCRIGTFKNHII